ncbi:DNA-binding transcriptional regulator, Lrp family [Amycolatopsis tolypomycina]|uniref:DNA-binding transcriptional regulator, Lrp family n=1 Tax=Amycolatopsis tolypomycina TaxID=208445 RepID=A0A1H4RGA0_9PSEU|nr:AsnC family transcriptional regulator [Amycolatopsis tolypomycina]SEC30701.1 DNA-binding transcriptional regulator, Lrp family [Amycolatopsis tolypomycina]
MSEESAMLAEQDLKLADALQAAPRASWSTLGRALGVGAVTAARRWDALVERGDAWLTAYAGGELLERLALAFVAIDCEPGAALPVASALASDVHVATVEYVAGPCDLLAHVVTPSVRELGAHVAGRVAAVPGVTRVRTTVSPRMFTEGSRWRVRAISPGQREALAPKPARRRTPLRFDAADRALILALGADARASAAALAESLGIGATTVRRRLDGLLGRGAIRVRCEIARSVSPAPVTVTLWLRVPPDKLETTARSLAMVPEVRMCAALAGAENLMLVVWLPAQQDLLPLEAGLAAKLPWLEITGRAVTLRSVKLMGRLLDAAGRATGRVPLDFWAAVPVPEHGDRSVHRSGG